MEDIVEKIQARLSKPDLVINRVPKNTLERFYGLANQEDFSNDYGMALKYLMDLHDGIIVTGLERLEDITNQHEERLNRLEAEQVKDKVNYIKTLSGRRIEGRKDE